MVKCLSRQNSLYIPSSVFGSFGMQEPMYFGRWSVLGESVNIGIEKCVSIDEENGDDIMKKQIAVTQKIDPVEKQKTEDNLNKLASPPTFMNPGVVSTEALYMRWFRGYEHIDNSVTAKAADELEKFWKSHFVRE